MEAFNKNTFLFTFTLFLLISITNIEIGWNLPDADPATSIDATACLPSAPVLPRIPNQTSNANPCDTDESLKYTYGCCAPPPPPVASAFSPTEHLLGRPIDAFLNPTNMNRAQLERNDLWLSCSNGSIPAGAVEGGQDVDGGPLYVARAEVEGSLTPGKVI